MCFSGKQVIFNTWAVQRLNEALQYDTALWLAETGFYSSCPCDQFKSKSHLKISKSNNIFHVNPSWAMEFFCVLHMKSPFLVQTKVSMLNLQWETESLFIDENVEKMLLTNFIVNSICLFLPVGVRFIHLKHQDIYKSEAC